MRRFCILGTFCALCVQSNLFAQSNISAPMSFRIVKDVIPPLLRVMPQSQSFIDQDKNGVIDANENCAIRFEITNEGRGDGYGCVARITATGTTDGLLIQDVPLPVIPRGAKQWIEVPIVTNENTKTGEIQFSIVVDEPNGFGTDPITGVIGTHKLRAPYVQVASYKVAGAKGGKLNRREPFKLQVIVQNTDQGTAENVTVGLQLPDNVNWTGGTEEHLNIGMLKPNETKTLEYELMANQRAADQINVKVAVAERTGKYAKSADIPLQFGQYVGSSIAMNVARNDKEVAIQKASLISDVDENIPVTNTENPNSFVLIIANEHYQQVAAVPFALNDGNIFREYCIKTLGIEEKHIHYVPDATGNQIKAQINWLRNITEAFDNAQVIVYYAGHGIPDEATKTAYLLPVDGNGSDVTTGYKLDDLYSTLGNMSASRITIFMDACFSGSKREKGMLVSARGVALKAKSGVPQGNMVVFSAAQGDETAYPNREQQHGMFTYYLLKRLQETEGNTGLKELGDYITKNVSQQSLVENNKLQTPCVIPSASVGTEWQNLKLRYTTYLQPNNSINYEKTFDGSYGLNRSMFRKFRRQQKRAKRDS